MSKPPPSGLGRVLRAVGQAVGRVLAATPSVPDPQASRPEPGLVLRPQRYEQDFAAPSVPPSPVPAPPTPPPPPRRALLPSRNGAPALGLPRPGREWLLDRTAGLADSGPLLAYAGEAPAGLGGAADWFADPLQRLSSSTQNPQNESNAQPKPQFLFDAKGKLLRINPNGQSNLGGILNVEGTAVARTFVFNDPTEDGKYLANPRENGYPVEPEIHTFGPADIDNVLYGISPETKQPYTDMRKAITLSPREKLRYALKESVYGNQLDSTNKRDGALVTKDFYLVHGIAYNASDMGNFMWAYAMHELGMPWTFVKVGSEYYAFKDGKSSNGLSEPVPNLSRDYTAPEWVKDLKQWAAERTWTGDTQGDQQAIAHGYYYKRLQVRGDEARRRILPQLQPPSRPWQLPRFDRFKWLLVFVLSASLGACQQQAKPAPVSARTVAEAFYKAYHTTLPSPWMRRADEFLIYPIRSGEEDGKRRFIYCFSLSSRPNPDAEPTAEYADNFSDLPRFRDYYKKYYVDQKHLPGDSISPKSQALMAIFHLPLKEVGPTLLRVSDSAIADHQRLARFVTPLGASFPTIGKHHKSYVAFYFEKPNLQVVHCADSNVFGQVCKRYYAGDTMHKLGPNWYWREKGTPVEGEKTN